MNTFIMIELKEQRLETYPLFCFFVFLKQTFNLHSIMQEEEDAGRQMN